MCKGHSAACVEFNVSLCVQPNEGINYFDNKRHTLGIIVLPNSPKLIHCQSDQSIILALQIIAPLPLYFIRLCAVYC